MKIIIYISVIQADRHPSTFYLYKHNLQKVLNFFRNFLLILTCHCLFCMHVHDSKYKNTRMITSKSDGQAHMNKYLSEQTFDFDTQLNS